jgi:hypothetical protein
MTFTSRLQPQSVRPLPVDRNGSSDTASDSNRAGPYSNGAQRKNARLLQDGQKQLDGEISRLRGEVEDLREQQQALQRDPHSEDPDLGNDVEDSTEDEGDRKRSSGARRVRR